MTAVHLDPIPAAIAAIEQGRAVVVVDDEGRENEGDLIFAAAHATEELLAFTIRYSSGVICVPMTSPRLAELDLPPMTDANTDPLRTAFAVSADARTGVSTGISAADRAHTIRLLADPTTGPQDLVRPGHVFPLEARPGGVLERRGHTEAAVDLVSLAGLGTAGVLVELVHDDGTMMRTAALRAFADEHGLPMVSIEDLAAYRRSQDLVERVATTTLPTAHGTFTAHGYRTRPGGQEHLVLVRGEVRDQQQVLVRVHSECLTGDVLGSQRCDCGAQLDGALAQIDDAGRGIVVYLRGQEGRGIGLVEKLRAYVLQDAGRDTVEANLDLGHPVDTRSYTAAAAILRDLGPASVRLLTNNPQKISALRDGGVQVSQRAPCRVPPGTHNARYLATKRDRLGHHL